MSEYASSIFDTDNVDEKHGHLFEGYFDTNYIHVCLCTIFCRVVSTRFFVLLVAVFNLF